MTLEPTSGTPSLNWNPTAKVRDPQAEDRFLENVRQKLFELVFFMIIPKYSQCLGNSPKVDAEAFSVGISDLSKACPATGLPYLNVANLEKGSHFVFQSTVCESCLSLDFSNNGATEPILGGTYVKNQWKNTYGITISASSVNGGFTPDDNARVYNTTLPVSQNNGNFDLGSPNVKCGGIGVGLGGEPGQPGENCVPIQSK
jgi:hypothetical protein